MDFIDAMNSELVKNGKNTINSVDEAQFLQVKESLNLITNALNKSSKEGVFTIDDAYLIKVALTHIDNFINKNDNKTKKNT